MNNLITVRATVYLPPDLADAAERLIESGRVKNRNDLMIMGLRQMIKQYEREAIDAEFDAMGRDEDYQAEERTIMAEFDAADRESLRVEGR